MKNKNPHRHQSCQSHCCVSHSCKYGYDDCPVVLGLVKQEYLCESCEYDGITRFEQLEYFGTDFWRFTKAFNDLGINYVVVPQEKRYKEDPCIFHRIYLTGGDRVFHPKYDRYFEFENYRLVRD